jgi:glycosyltransferase involved in cell wall biosynthesis
MILSVIIPAYNRATVLPQAIKSVFEQGFEDLEVIVVDDASRDNTQDVMNAMTQKDPRITYIRHPRNLGGAAARNTAIERARGEYIAFLDSDDEWLPHKLERQMDLFKKLDASYGVIYTGLQVIYEESKKGEIYRATHRGSFLNELLIANCVRTLSSVVVKRQYLQAVGGLDARLKSCQDWDLYIRLMKHCKFECIEDPLVIYYVNKEDPSRISNKGRSIIQGHNLIADKYKEDYKKLSPAERVRYLESISEMYSLGGSLPHPVGMMAQAFLLTGKLKYLSRGLRYFARFFKRKFNKQYGY